MNYKILAVSSLLLIGSSSVFATISGKELLNDCLNKSTYPQQVGSGKSFCIGYIAGFLDTYVLTTALYGVTDQNRHFCLGQKGISYNKAMQVAINYLQDNKDQLNESARKLLVKAYAKNFPCKQGQNQDQNQDDNRQTKENDRNNLDI